METRLREYMDDVFRDVRPTRKSVELKEEILQNLIDKYHDLVAQGKSPEAAYNIAIASIGDMNELLGAFREEQKEPDYVWEEIEAEGKKRSAILISVAVMLYIISIIPPVIFSYISDDGLLGEVIGPCLMLLLIALATGILIYNGMTRPKKKDYDETIVEEFREWHDRSKEKKQAMKSVRGAVGSLILVAYFVVSFTTGAWHITWVLFLVEGALDNVVKAIFDLKG